MVVRPELKDRFKERVSMRSRDALWFHIVFDPVPAAIEMRLSDTIGQWIWSSATAIRVMIPDNPLSQLLSQFAV